MAISKRIVYTRHGGGVAVCLPAAECMTWLANGGYWDGRGIDLEAQVERSMEAGHFEWAARRFVRALDRGGCTTAEAFEIIRDRDCAHRGTACDLIDASELPDRWFRNAWRRSQNGGPISIDLTVARKIQLKRLQGAAVRHKAELELPRWRERIRRASNPEQICQVWPRGLAL